MSLQDEMEKLVNLEGASRDDLKALINPYVTDLKAFAQDYYNEPWYESVYKAPWRFVFGDFNEDTRPVRCFFRVKSQMEQFKEKTQNGAIFKQFKAEKDAELAKRIRNATTVEEKNELQELRTFLNSSNSFVEFAKKTRQIPDVLDANIPEIANKGSITFGTSADFNKYLNKLQETYLEASYCTAYQMRRGTLEQPDLNETYEKRLQYARDEVAKLIHEDARFEFTKDATRVRMKWRPVGTLEGERDTYDALLKTIQDNPDWQRACAYMAQKDPANATHWSSMNLNEMVTLPPRNTDWGVDDLPERTLEKIKPTADALEAATLAEHRYYLALNAMREYSKSQEAQGRTVRTTTPRGTDDNNRPTTRTPSEPTPTLPAPTDTIEAPETVEPTETPTETDDKEKDKPATTTTDEPLPFETPEQAIPVILEAQKRLNAIDIAGLEQKLRTMERLDKNNTAGIESLRRQLEEQRARKAELEAEIQGLKDYAGDAWTKYEAEQKQRAAEAAKPKGVSSRLGKAGENVEQKKAAEQSRLIQEEERRRIAAQDAARLEAVEEEKGIFGKIWDFIKEYWGIFLTVAIGALGYWGYNKYKDNKDAKAAKKAAQSVSNTVSKTNSTIKSVTSSVDKLTSSSTSLGTKVNAADKLSSTVSVLLGNSKSK